MTEDTNTKAAELEALLFAAGTAMKKSALQKHLGCSEVDLEAAVHALRERLEGGGTTLLETDTELRLVTAPHVTELVEQVHHRALEGDIGQAGLEILAIVLYRGATTRSRIDYIRGVNSSATLRTLVSRGLLERIRAQEGDAREFLYRPTTELLAHLGVERSEMLPEFEDVRREIQTFEAREATREAQEHAQEQDNEREQ